jgi:hypothetical protein
MAVDAQKQRLTGMKQRKLLIQQGFFNDRNQPSGFSGIRCFSLSL